MMDVIAHIYRYVVCQLSKSQKIKWTVNSRSWLEWGKEMTKVEFGWDNDEASRSETRAEINKLNVCSRVKESRQFARTSDAELQTNSG